MEKFSGIFSSIIYKWQQKLLQGYWNQTWELILEGVKKAEEQFDTEEEISDKKKWVYEKVMSFIESKIKLNWFFKFVISSFLNAQIDAIVFELNDKLGHDWIKQAEKIRDKLAGIIPIIE